MKTKDSNNRKIILCSAVILLVVIAISNFAKNELAIAQIEGTPTPELSKQEQIDKLLDAYQRAVDYELKYGDTIEIQDPEEGTIRELTGESKTKIEGLWQSTVQQINELSARPVEERAKAVQMIQSIEPGDVMYLDRDLAPYDISISLERYQTAKFIYSIDIATNQVIKIVPVEEWNFNVDAIYSSEELEAKAREFISLVAKEINLDDLTPAFGNKSGEMFFFRWEDRSRILSGDSHMNPFIQVGFSHGGDLLNFENTLSLSTVSSMSSLTSFNEIYSNGGSHWDWLQGSYIQKDNAGYCYLYGGSWCTPKNFYCQYTNRGTVTAKGQWKPNSNPNVKASAFIPSTYATTTMACYRNKYNGGTHEKCINQSIWYNTWVSITSMSLNNIQKIILSNAVDFSTKLWIAWDETWVYTP